MNTTLSSLVKSASSPSETSSESPAGVRGKWFYLSIPWLLLIGFFLLAWVLFGERLLPATVVELDTVVTVKQSSREAATVSETTEIGDPWQASLLFQASGWIEPDPLPIKATALVNGVVETVLVLEGDQVSKGQVLATMIREDFELDVATAESELAALKAEAEAHEASIETVDAQIHSLHMKVKAGEMKCLELEDQRNRLQRAGEGSVAAGDLAAATLRLQTHNSEVSALEATKDELLSEKRQLEATTRQFASQIAKAKTELAKRELALSRSEIRSPVDGVVLRLLAVPGQKRMLDMDDADSATVAILYQPDFLQARIDVPLEEASGLSVGQAVRLRSNFLQDRIFQGVVTRIAGEADLQRNTLQAKVKVIDPDARLRPDMLCRAEFLSGTQDAAVGAGEGGSGRVDLFVSEAALLSPSGREAQVWVVDSTGERIEKRSVVLGEETREGHRLVREGLRPGDRVVLNPSTDLVNGERIEAGKGARDE